MLHFMALGSIERSRSQSIENSTLLRDFGEACRGLAFYPPLTIDEKATLDILVG
jgi:hypothetical protein